MIFIFVTGAILCFRTKFIQLRGFAPAFRFVFSKKQQHIGSVTPLQAFAASLGGCAGIGNITGVIAALSSAGAGAVFWMWIASFFGMVLKYSEICLGCNYRIKQNDGTFAGGPMYYLKICFPFAGKYLSELFCFAGMLVSFGMGNMVQVNTACSGLLQQTGTEKSNAAVFSLALITAVVVFVAVCGGMKRVGKLSGTMVPFMSVLYIAVCITVICANISNLPQALTSIVKQAFDINALSSGVCAAQLSRVVSAGLSKGIFSNEAGLGTSSIMHADAGFSQPYEQGLAGIPEVFFDTVVMCSLTALSVLCVTNDFSGASADMSGFIIGVWAYAMPQKAAQLIYSVCIVFFAFSSVLSWGYYGKVCFSYMFSSAYTKLFCVIFALFSFIGVLTDIRYIWIISDTFNALMLLPNLAALLAFSGKIKQLTPNKLLHFSDDKVICGKK